MFVPRLRRLLMALFLSVLAGATGSAVVGPPNADPAGAAIGGLTWSDEFNGAAGTAPASSRWRYDIGGGGWGNSELEYYTNRTANSAHDGNGNLVITARREGGFSCWYGPCQYTSARLL